MPTKSMKFVFQKVNESQKMIRNQTIVKKKGKPLASLRSVLLAVLGLMVKVFVMVNVRTVLFAIANGHKDQIDLLGHIADFLWRGGNDRLEVEAPQ